MKSPPKWPKGTVGRKMTDQIISAKPNKTIAEVIARLRLPGGTPEMLHYIYVVDDHRRLLGVLSSKDLFRQKLNTVLVNIMTKDQLITIGPEASREEATYLALKHNLKAIPVVDQQNTLLGVVSDSTIFSTLYKEVHADLLHLAGIFQPKKIMDDILHTSLWRSFAHRIPWLLIGLFGGIVAARVVGTFEQTLSQNLVLAAYIPLIVYMSDAVGTQMEAFIIRDFAIDNKLNFKKYFFSQLLIVVMIATTVSLALLVMTNRFYPDSAISIVISVAMFVATVSSVFTGLLIPRLLRSLRQDPANASGPIATVIQDVLSIVIYFTIATKLL